MKEDFQLPENCHSLLINPDELILKGRNKRYFFKILSKHIRRVVTKYYKSRSESDSFNPSNIFTLEKDGRRIVLESINTHPIPPELLRQIEKIPGIHSFYLTQKILLLMSEYCYDFKKFIDDIQIILFDELSQVPLANDVKTFKVETKRSFKGISFSSMEISRELGSRILSKYPHLKVNLASPDLTISIKITETCIYISQHKVMGVGGLPVGCSGNIVTLLSGGIDSPVASYLMSKRGCRQTFVFFHSYPYVGNEVLEKIHQLTKILSQYQNKCRLVIVGFGEIQKLIAQEGDPNYRTLLMRKYMFQLAGLVAAKIKATALLTGDSLGQVASQTLGNLNILQLTSPLPILRPLLGLNKIEVIQLAKKIGSYDTSIIDQPDACALFAPPQPITNPHTDYFLKLLKKIESHDTFDTIIKNTMDRLDTFEFH